MTITTTSDIRVGEEITLSYFDNWDLYPEARKDAAVRRRLLNDMFMFTCQCVACRYNIHL